MGPKMNRGTMLALAMTGLMATEPAMGPGPMPMLPGSYDRPRKGRKYRARGTTKKSAATPKAKRKAQRAARRTNRKNRK